MKKLNKLLILTIILFSSLALSAQVNNFLPLSSESEAAKSSFHQALGFLWNAHMDQYRAKWPIST